MTGVLTRVIGPNTIGDSIWICEATEPDTGTVITFGVDWRIGMELSELLDAGEEVPVASEGWQILHTQVGGYSVA